METKELSSSELELSRLLAESDQAPSDQTREFQIEADASWVTRVLEEFPRISYAPASEADAIGNDLVAERVLGEGGMGVVTLCRQRSLARDVAVKTLRPGEATLQAMGALVDEARITGALEHPNIVPVHSLGRGADGSPLLVMKRVSGVVWRDLVCDPAHPAWSQHPGDRLTFHIEVLRKVCDAVQFADSRGVVHRDLKTANVMIGEFGEVYVLDWGIACTVNERGERARQVVGTPAFMAPEMLSQGTKPLTERTDVYLLGGMLHEVLTGHVRHRGKELLEVLYGAWRSEPFNYPPSVPHELAALCNRATRRDPAERLASARDFAQALATFHERRSSGRMTEVACRRVEALKALAPGSDHAAAQRLWTEASFGFRQALESWPGNLKALDGRREAIASMARHEIAGRNPGAAEELLATLDPAPDELTSALALLRAELSAEASEVDRLRALGRELDPSVSAQPRAHAAAVVAVAAVAAPLALGVLRARGVSALSHRTLALALAALMLLTLAVAWWRRGVLLANRAGRALVAMPVVALVSALVSLGVGARLGVPASASVLSSLLVVSAMFAVTGVSSDRRLLIVSATALAGTLAAAVFPAHALDLAALACLGACVEIALVFRLVAREGAR